jgi:hypothetical protein
VTIDAKLNGGPFPQTFSNFAELSVVDEDGHETTISSTADPTLVINLVDGTYDVLYRWRNGFNSLPRNALARVASDRVIDGATTLAFDVPMVELEFEPRIDGAPFPASPTERAALYLQGTEPGDRFLLGRTDAGPTLRALVVAGWYEVIYDWEIGGATVPLNRNERVVERFHTSDLSFVPVDVSATTIAPSATLNGEPFPTDGVDAARLLLRSPSGGEAFLLETTEAGAAPRRRYIDGAYGVEYQWLAGIEIPRNGQQRIQTVYVPEPGSGLALAAGSLLLVWLRRASRPAA